MIVEPTECESKAEMDRFIDAMVRIRQEIRQIEDGQVPKEGNLLKMAPHTAADLLGPSWDRPYSREEAAYPLAHLRAFKFWPAVGRLDDVFGDQQLVCTTCS